MPQENDACFQMSPFIATKEYRFVVKSKVFKMATALFSKSHYEDLIYLVLLERDLFLNRNNGRCDLVLMSLPPIVTEITNILHSWLCFLSIGNKIFWQTTNMITYQCLYESTSVIKAAVCSIWCVNRQPRCWLLDNQRSDFLYCLVLFKKKIRHAKLLSRAKLEKRFFTVVWK